VDFLDPVELFELATIPGRHGPLIYKTINEMISMDMDARCTLDLTLDRLITALENYGKDFEAFHGRYFIGQYTGG
jgi:hypothetical protein